MRDHTKVGAFDPAGERGVLVYRVTAGFPREELYSPASHIRRAAVSVPPNLVEGCAGDSQADYLRFLHTDFRSLMEWHYQLSLSKRLGFVGNQDLSASFLADLSLIEPEISKQRRS